MAKIVLIDDDHGPMDYYIEALKLTGHDVTHIDHVDDVESLSSNIEDAPDYFIIDLMMPPGKYEKEGADGKTTGLFVARDVRAKWPHTPIMFLSQASHCDVPKKAKELSKMLCDCEYYAKYDISPFELVKMIAFHEANGRFKTGLGQRIWDAIHLRPGIGGVSVDLKKLKD